MARLTRRERRLAGGAKLSRPAAPQASKPDTHEPAVREPAPPEELAMQHHEQNDQEHVDATTETTEVEVETMSAAATNGEADSATEPESEPEQESETHMSELTIAANHDALPTSPAKKLKFKGLRATADVANYLRALASGIESGKLILTHRAESLALTLPSAVEIELEARQKSEKGRIEFEISWRDDSQED